LADAKDETAMALIYHTHAMQKDELPVSEMDDELAE
jgi:hypothetical protein